VRAEVVGAPSSLKGGKTTRAWLCREGETVQQEVVWEAWRKVRVVRRAAAVVALILLGGAVLSHAQSPKFLADCRAWVERKGYSTDYIEQKTGKRQPGLAGSWRGNVDLDRAEPGDVVLVRLRAPGAMHAALVEEVRRGTGGAVSAVRVSEWNWGRMTDERCLVTENFARLAPARWVDADAIALVWRPSQPLP
jgi:hypothetical protein